MCSYWRCSLSLTPRRWFLPGISISSVKRDDGTIPDDNPYVGRAGFKPGIFTSGHRNGHGLAFNPETGELWETEQGPSGGDEINVLHSGKNYGWPLSRWLGSCQKQMPI